jgi:fructose-1,6-bisphosphatase/inositol monophosphatase family enzyme
MPVASYTIPMKETLHLMARKVREAERAIPDRSDRGEEIGMGADGSPTLFVDKLAEDVILKFVEERDLPFNVLSEEAGLVDRGKKKTLVIDPIDGTYNAAMGVPFYSVSLAVATHSLRDAEMALVQNLVTGDTYFAEKGKGAFLNGKRIHVRKFSHPNSTFLCYMGKYSTSDTLELMRKARRSRSLGCASLEMCLIAEGKADAYYLNCEVKERAIRVVDIAASALILWEAGGEIVDMSDRPLDMRLDLEDRRNYVAYGDEAVKGVFF